MEEKDKPEQSIIRKEEVVTEVASINLQSVWDKHLLLNRISVVQQLVTHFQRAIRNITATPLLALLSTFTAFLALFLLTVFLFTGKNLNSYLQNMGSSQEVSLFLKDNFPAQDAASLAKIIGERPEVKSSHYVSKSEALTSFSKSLGTGNSLLRGLENNNPLPASVELTIKGHMLDAEGMKRFVEQMRSQKGVVDVRYSTGIFEDFSKLFSFVGKAGVFMVLLLLLVTAVILSNTINLAIFSHRDEIRIMRLLGANPSYIRAPFLVEGSLIGLVGALLAIGFSFLGYNFLLSYWPEVLTVSQIFPKPEFLGIESFLLILITGFLVGLLGGAWGSRVYRKF